jgi:CO/xanthine dehydrogenase Mo-binding subunit
MPRLDARDKVTGAADYSGDLTMKGMLFMKILFAERPHARVVRINTSRAEGAPGVTAVFTANDVPVNEYGLQIPDQPVLCGRVRPNPEPILSGSSDQVAVVATSEVEGTPR